MSVILSNDQLAKIAAAGIKNFHINGNGEIDDEELDSIIETIVKMKSIKQESHNGDAI